MGIVIRPHSVEYAEAVLCFNQRLKAGGAADWMQAESSPEARWLPKRNGEPLFNETFLALENNEVRGAYVLKHQDFSFGGNEVRSIGYYHHPISEGTINRAYATVGALMIRDALRRQPMLYALGMDGCDKPLPQMLKLLGWKSWLVPFYFLVLRPFRFLRQMEAIRENSRNRLLTDLAAFSGMGWLGIKAVHGIRRLRGRTATYTAKIVPTFENWSDDVWQRGRNQYSMTAVRDSSVLNKLYPLSEPHFVRLQVGRNGAAVGWAVVAERGPKPRFGKLRVASIVDCFAAPEDAPIVAHAAADALKQRGFDMLVTNQSNAAWGKAFEHCGFFKGPSNFLWAASPQLSDLLQPFDLTKVHTHFTRGDGDGLPRSF